MPLGKNEGKMVRKNMDLKAKRHEVKFGSITKLD